MQEASVKETKNGNLDNKYISPRRLKTYVETLEALSLGSTGSNRIYVNEHNRIVVDSQDAVKVAEFTDYGMYLPLSGKPAGLYVESPIEARGGIQGGALPLQIHNSFKSTHAVDISNTNLNDLVGNGWFKGASMTNAPNDGGTDWWYIEQMVHIQGTWRVQTAYPLSGALRRDTHWTRIMRSGVWSSWVSQRPNQKITLAIGASPLTIYTTAWQVYMLPFDITYGVTVGDRLTRQGNAVRIGAGIRTVEIGATFSWYNLGTSTDTTMNVYKNGSWQGALNYDASDDTYCTTSGQPMRIGVAEGDLITIGLNRGLTGNVQIFGNLCRLNVEAIE